MEHPIFQPLDGLPVIICKTCQYRVWPREIVRHLKDGAHGKTHQEAVQIQETVQRWEGIAMGPEGVVIPRQVEQAWPGLPTYPDGLLCRRDYPRCRYIGRSLHSIRKHWQTVHGWTRQGSRGRVTPAERTRQEAEVRQSYIVVHCQQIFPSRTGSHYIHVRGGETEPHIPVRTEQVDEAIAAVRQAVDEAQAHAPSGAGEDVRDANSWLRVTRWTQYLQDVTTPDDFTTLQALVETPLPNSDNPVEQRVRRIWEAMESVVR